MQINNPAQQVPFVMTSDGKRIYCKRIEIGPYNMSLPATKHVAHGITSALTKIISVTALIRSDLGTTVFPISQHPIGIPSLNDVIEIIIDGTNIDFVVSAASVWATTGNFNSVLISRGEILVWFVE